MATIQFKRGTGSSALADGEPGWDTSTHTLYVGQGGTNYPINVSPATYAQGKLLGRGSASGTGVAEVITVGSGLDLSGTNLSCTVTQYTDEMAQDAVGNALVDSSTIDFSYDDAGNSITASVIDASITFAKIQNVTAAKLLGRTSASTGAPQEISLGTGLNMSGTTLNTSALVSPLTTKGDLLVYSTAAARLAVGTDGMMLVADSSTTEGVKWVVGPPQLTTKGDLLVFSNTTSYPVRLGVGGDNQVLIADSTQAVGVKWGDTPTPLTTKGDLYCFSSVNTRLGVGSDGQILAASSSTATGLQWTGSDGNWSIGSGTLSIVAAPLVLRLIPQVSHGFSAGDWLRWDSGTSKYAKAKADTLANSQVVGYVSNVASVNGFYLTLVGETGTGLSGLTANTQYYLSPTTAGAITATKPTTAGQVVKPVLIATGAASGYVQIGQGSVVAGYTTGDLPYASATDTLSNLAIGTTGKVLTVASGVPSWADPVTGTTGNGTLGSDYTVTGSWGDVGISVSIPSAGTWLITYQPHTLAQTSAATGAIDVRLYDVTNSAAISNSDRRVYTVGASFQRGQVALSHVVTTAGAVTIRLESQRVTVSGTPVWTNSIIYSSYTRMDYVRLK